MAFLFETQPSQTKKQRQATRHIVVHCLCEIIVQNSIRIKLIKTYKRPTQFRVISCWKPLSSNMCKLARHQPGFYASLFDDISDRDLSHKYRPKQRPVVMGIYEVERMVSKRNQGSNVDCFIQVISRQVPCFSWRTRAQNGIPSSGESSRKVHEELVHRKYAVNSKRRF